MVKKIKLALALAAAGTGAALMAHPTDVPYDTRGECEAAFAESSMFDRERLVDDLGVFETYGAAQRTFRDRFECTYDEEADAWFIIDHFPMP